MSSATTRSPVEIETQLSEAIQYCRAMLQLQENINQRIHPQWRQQRYPWYRAIWIECAELLDHHNWKWWKKQTPDLAQIQLELVDIWHFGLSDSLQRSDNLDQTAERLGTLLFNTINHSQTSKIDGKNCQFPEIVERFTANTLTHKKFDETIFCQLLASSSLSILSLYKHYIGKNVLNRFRQDHGYQTGDYVKQWNGIEDNEHLAELMSKLPINSTDAATELYQQLTKRYVSLVLETIE